MSRLTAEDIDELEALSEMNRATGKPSFVLRRHWHESNYRSLVQQGLVEWGDPPEGFSWRRWAGATITVLGSLTLAAALKARDAQAATGGQP